MNSFEWMRSAACRGADPEMFFPRVGEWGKADAAKAICATCPVKLECYDAGRDEQFGIWGGTSVKERQRQETGHTSGRIRVRGCWRCGMPTADREHYCSDWCRAEARRDTARRSRLKRLEAS